MAQADFDHDFEEEDSCGVCGASQEEHSDPEQEEDEFDHDYEHPDVCVHCAMSEADEQHQGEE